MMSEIKADKSEVILDKSKIKEQKKWRIVKNLIVCSLFLTLFMTADTPLEAMQSSYNIEDGMGTISLSVGIAASIVSLFFLTSLFTDLFGLKKLVVAGGLAVCLFSLANLQPSWVTLIPGAIILKVIGCLGRSSTYSLITYFTEKFSKLSVLPKEKLYSVVFGIAMTAENSGAIFGNLVSYFVTSQNSNEMNLTEIAREHCGPYFVDGEHSDNSNFEKMPQFYVHVLFGTFAGIAALSGLISFLFLDSVPKVKSEATKCSLVLDTFRLTKSKVALMLIVCDFHRGFWAGVLVTDVAKVFDVCLGGLQLLGLAAALFGIGTVVFSAVFSWMAKVWNRWVVFVIINFLEIGSIVTSLLWQPSWFSNDTVFVLVLSVTFGAGYAGNAFLFYMLHGYLFPKKKEASMALCTLSENLGASVSLGLSSTVAFTPKLYVLLGIVCLSFFCYLGIEIPLKKSNIIDTKDESLESVNVSEF